MCEFYRLLPDVNYPKYYQFPVTLNGFKIKFICAFISKQFCNWNEKTFVLTAIEHRFNFYLTN